MSDYRTEAAEPMPLFDMPPPASRREALGFWTATDADLAKLTDQKREILKRLRGAWVTGRDLIETTGAAEATRRVRELRADGYDIEKRGGGRLVEYRWNGNIRG